MDGSLFVIIIWIVSISLASSTVKANDMTTLVASATGPTSIVVNWTLSNEFGPGVQCYIHIESNDDKYIRKVKTSRGQETILGLKAGVRYSVFLKCTEGKMNVETAEFYFTLDNNTVTTETTSRFQGNTDPSITSGGREAGLGKEKPTQREKTNSSMFDETNLTHGNVDTAKFIGSENTTNVREPSSIKKDPSANSAGRGSLDWWHWVTVVGGGGIALIFVVALTIFSVHGCFKHTHGNVTITKVEESVLVVSTMDEPPSDRVVRHPSVKESPAAPPSMSYLSANQFEGGRAVQSGISWGSEFDLLDEPPLDCSTVNRNRPSSRRPPPPPQLATLSSLPSSPSSPRTTNLYSIGNANYTGPRAYSQKQHFQFDLSASTAPQHRNFRNDLGNDAKHSDISVESDLLYVNAPPAQSEGNASLYVNAPPRRKELYEEDGNIYANSPPPYSKSPPYGQPPPIQPRRC